MKLKKNSYYFFLSLIVIYALLYLPTFNAYFVNDDYNWIKPIEFTDVISTFWGSWGHGALYRPIPRLLFYLQYLIFGDSPTGFHIISILLFSILTFLFYKLVFGLTKNSLLSVISVIVCIFYFGNHEVVCWISAQTVLLGAVFSFGALYFYQLFINDEQKKYILLSCMFYSFALLSYESTIVVPLLLISISLLGGVKLFTKKSILILACYISISAVYLILRHYFLSGVPEANALNTDPYIMISDFVKMIKFQIITKPYFLIALVVSILGLLFFKLEKKYLLFGLFWFIAAFIPFLFVDGYAGRFSFVSMFGTYIIIGSGLSSLIKKNSVWKIVCILLIAFYSVYGGVLTYQNSGYWYESGEIARSIPVQLKNIHSEFPENSTLIFFDIPLGYQQSGVFLTYFEEVIQRNYAVKLNVIHVAHPFNKDMDLSKYESIPNTYRFKYFLEERQLKELK